MKTRQIICLLVVTFYFSSFSYAQTQTLDKELSTKRTDLGIALQLYPAGIIPTINLEQYTSKNTSLLFRLGGNFVDRQDFSDENDEEEGSGFGGSIGYRKHYPLKKGKIIAGINFDAWNLWIDWRDDINLPQESFGTTYTLVLQPWLEAGYYLPLKDASSQLGMTLGFGREVNVITRGKDVEEGFIGSLSVYYQFSLKKKKK